MTVAEVLAAERAWVESESEPADKHPLWIKGQEVPPIKGNWLNVANPLDYALKMATLDATLALVAVLGRLDARLSGRPFPNQVPR